MARQPTQAFQHKFAAGIFLCGVAIASSAAAQDAMPQSETSNQCELHIWPGDDFGSLPFGGIFSDVSANTDTQFDEIATSQLQFDAILQSSPVKALGLPENTSVITHPETETDKITKKRKTRRAESTSSCYFELHIRSSYLVEDIVWGDRFATTFDFRKYSGTEQWELRHRGEGANKLTVFPVKEEDDPDEVKREVREKIGENFLEYARKAKRKLMRSKR